MKKMKAIDLMMIKKAIQEGQLEVFKGKGNVYIRDPQTTECICIYRKEGITHRSHCGCKMERGEKDAEKC